MYVKRDRMVDVKWALRRNGRTPMLPVPLFTYTICFNRYRMSVQPAHISSTAGALRLLGMNFCDVLWLTTIRRQAYVVAIVKEQKMANDFVRIADL